jgi:hypothetical protein
MGRGSTEGMREGKGRTGRKGKVPRRKQKSLAEEQASGRGASV